VDGPIQSEWGADNHLLKIGRWPRLVKRMSKPYGFYLVFVFCLLSPVSAQQIGVQPALDAAAIPALPVQSNTSRPRVEPEGLIHLDVVVKDSTGKRVSGIDRSDFTLFDNGQSEKIVSFHAFGGSGANPDPPVSVILLIDTRDVPKETAIDEQRGLEKFLRQNDGQLAQPVTIYSLESRGSGLVAGPSLDGKALAAALEHPGKLVPLTVPPLSFQTGQDPEQLRRNLQDRPYFLRPSLAVLMEVGVLLAAQRQYAGRKLLLWIGPGVIGSGAYPEPMDIGDRQDLFDKIYWFSTVLREARVTLSTISVGDNNPGVSIQPGYRGQRDPWEKFLNGVTSADQATAMDLYKKVLAVESGGTAPLIEGDLAKQVEACLQDSDSFYTLTFDPPLV
jgi:VWFA-related protein